MERLRNGYLWDQKKKKSDLEWKWGKSKVLNYVEPFDDM